MREDDGTRGGIIIQGQICRNSFPVQIADITGKGTKGWWPGLKRCKEEEKMWVTEHKNLQCGRK